VPVTRLSDREARDVARSRPRTETHITCRPDRVRPYLLCVAEAFDFYALSDSYLARGGLSDLLRGVAVPLRAEGSASADGGVSAADGGVSAETLAGNMARVLGADPRFRWRQAYAAVILRVYGDEALRRLTEDARACAAQGRHEEACALCRAALALRYDDLPAMEGYALSLTALYKQADGKDESYVGNLKAEALEYLELMTDFYPGFSPGWYHLGYLYLNLGLYKKAQLAWERFIETTGGEPAHAEEVREIAQRLRQIEDPVRIEQGVNEALAGRYEACVEILEPYRKGRYGGWWPLWRWLGAAYAHTGRREEAVAAFKEALRVRPSATEVMEELAEVFEALGDSANAQKYREKIELIRF